MLSSAYHEILEHLKSKKSQKSLRREKVVAYKPLESELLHNSQRPVYKMEYKKHCV